MFCLDRERYVMRPLQFKTHIPWMHGMYPRIEMYGEHKDMVTDYLGALSDLNLRVGTMLLYRCSEYWLLIINFARGQEWLSAEVKYFSQACGLMDMAKVEANGWTTKELN